MVLTAHYAQEAAVLCGFLKRALSRRAIIPRHRSTCTVTAPRCGLIRAGAATSLRDAMPRTKAASPAASGKRCPLSPGLRSNRQWIYEKENAKGTGGVL